MAVYGLIVFLETPKPDRTGRAFYIAVSFIITALSALCAALNAVLVYDNLMKAIEKNGWDGEWYRRGYDDQGVPFGSSENQECKIDSIAQSWAEVLQQLQYQSVDLVLLCLGDGPSESPAMLQALSNLRQMAVKRPILVWDYRSAVNSESEAIDFLLQEVSAKILPSSLSAAQLLDKIQQTLLTHSCC